MILSTIINAFLIFKFSPVIQMIKKWKEQEKEEHEDLKSTVKFRMENEREKLLNPNINVDANGTFISE